jgi:DegV family protein with EDD domain
MQNSKFKIGIVTEDIAALPEGFLNENKIELAHAILDWPEIEKVPGENIWQKIRNAENFGVKTLPKTSQATPKSYFDAFKKQLQGFEKILCLTVSSKISGCFNSAIQAREMLSEKEKGRIFIFDTLNAAAGQGLLVLKAIELAKEGKEIKEILEILKNLVLKTKTCFLLEDPKYLLSVGRITKVQAMAIKIAKKLGVYLISEFKDGLIKFGGISFAKDMAQSLFKYFKKKTCREKNFRVAINQCDNQKGAESLRQYFKNFGVKVEFVSEGPTLFAAGGPGILILGWQPIS